LTFDATPPPASLPCLEDWQQRGVTVCDLSGVERFLVWAVRWCASCHDDFEFADLCLRDSFERAGMERCLPAFRRYVSMTHGEPSPCPAAARLGCWRVNELEARTLHATACLQSDGFGEAWRTLARLGNRFETARAMLALGEVADALSGLGATVRPWNALAAG
jgi:hypothetical protein